MRRVKRNWYHSARGVHVIYFEIKKKEASSATFLFFSFSRSGQPFSTYECIAGSSLHIDEKVQQSDTREIISPICSFFFF
jgi:hypothetical protein